VTGGTGNLGRLVVPRLRTAGAEVRVLSRRPSTPADAGHHVGDLNTGAGVEAACAGATTVVHLAGTAVRRGTTGGRGCSPGPRGGPGSATS
jgi:uncharacterized protein YbjT (DUF2867 family)